MRILNFSQKFWGYKALYYAVLANGQLYNAAQPFILGHKIAKIYDTSPTINVTLEAGHFLSAVVHPVISSVVSQRPPPRRVQWGLHLKQLGCVDGALEPIEAAQGLKFRCVYDCYTINILKRSRPSGFYLVVPYVMYTVEINIAG